MDRFFFNAEAQRKQLVLSFFFEVIFFYATPHHRHPMGEDSFRQKILVFSIFHITSLFLCVTLRLCASYENICQYAKSLWRFPLQSRLLDVSLSPIRNVGRLSVKA